MFDSVSMAEISKYITFAGKSSVFGEDNIIPDLQMKGVTALCKILQNRKYAYLADEVGMGKTYQAIGVITMLLAEKKNASILIVAPNEAVQKNWRNELENFMRNNLLFDADIDIEKDVEVIHPVDIIKNYALERKKAKISIVRLTAFSTVGERVAKQGEREFSYRGSITSRQLCRGLTAVTGTPYKYTPYETYSSYEAGMLCGSAFGRVSPRYDIVIVDEAQNIRNCNNATAFFNYWMGLKKFKTDTNTEIGMRLEEFEKDAVRRRNCKYLLLSATPAHRGVESLRNQLLYFENAKSISEINHEYLEKFMIRRLRTYSGSSKYVVRNISADDVSKNLDVEQRMFLALVQSKLAQVQAANNATFKIGFLETFESYDASADKTDVDEETGETGKEFENGGSTYTGEKGSAPDKNLLRKIAESYGEAIGSDRYPPHPKLDFMAEEMETLIKVNLSSMSAAETPDKAIIFVRRLASVEELVNHRLNRKYEDKIISYWGEKLKLDKVTFSDVRSAFQKLYSKTTPDEEDEEITEDAGEDEKDIKSRLISWMSVKKSDKGNPYSSVSLFKKSMMRNKQNSYLFDENYYRTVHADESDGHFKKRVKGLVNASFVKEVCDYIQADYSRYIRQQSGKRQLNTSYLLALCCYVALSKEGNLLADTIKKFYMIKDKTESTGDMIRDKQIVRILSQTSLWNCLEKSDKESAVVLKSWFCNEKFTRREALKKWTEKYLKSSEAILEILYCYCNGRDRNNRTALCRKIWKELYSGKCSHGLRIKQLFSENNANLVCNQLLGGAEINCDYNPAFMNNQQWVMPATGGNKGNEALIRRFNTPFYPDVIVCTDVLKEGINLHLFCNRVYHYGLAWTPGDLEQRIGRVDRFFSKTHRNILAGDDAHIEVHYPYMGKSVDEQQLRKVLQFKLSADPLLDSSGDSRKDIEIDMTDGYTIDELVKFVPSQSAQTNFPYSGERFWRDE